MVLTCVSKAAKGVKPLATAVAIPARREAVAFAGGWPRRGRRGGLDRRPAGLDGVEEEQIPQESYGRTLRVYRRS